MSKMRLLSAARPFFIALAAFLLIPAPTQTWGASAHRIVARVAARNLSPVARQKVRAILAVSDTSLENSMANASVWPDRIDKRATGTDRWHFVNVPPFSPFSLSGMCGGGECITAKVDDMARRLRTNQTDFALDTKPIPFRPMTQQELAFLIHLVADIHQPLHAAANGDRGGSCVLLAEPLVNGPNVTDQLHGIWDHNVVSTAMAGRTEAQMVALLFQRFKSGAVVTQGDAADWARESHRIALDAVYKKLNIPQHEAPPGQCARNIQRVTVTSEYLASNGTTVERRLLEGGIRLSRVLNDVCSGAGCKANP